MIACLLCLQQAALSQVVPFHEPVGMLRTVVRKLSEQSHVKLEVSPEVWDSGLYLESRNLSLGELLEGIAATTHGAWRDKQGTLILVAYGVHQLPHSPKGTPLRSDTVRIALSPKAARFGQVMAQFRKNELEAVPHELTQWTQPDTDGLFSLATTDFANAASEALGGNVAFSVPDSAMESCIATSFSAGSNTVCPLNLLPSRRADQQFESCGRVIVARDSQPAQTRAHTESRALLRQLFDESINAGVVSAETWFHHQRMLGTKVDLSIWSQLVIMAVGQNLPCGEANEYETFYRTLSSPAQKKLLGGKSLSYTELDPAAQSRVRALVAEPNSAETTKNLSQARVSLSHQLVSRIRGQRTSIGGSGSESFTPITLGNQLAEVAWGHQRSVESQVREFPYFNLIQQDQAHLEVVVPDTFSGGGDFVLSSHPTYSAGRRFADLPRDLIELVQVYYKVHYHYLSNGNPPESAPSLKP